MSSAAMESVMFQYPTTMSNGNNVLSNGGAQDASTTKTLTGIKRELHEAKDDDGVLDAKRLKETPADEETKQEELDIVINNVVCSFSVRCHLNLRDIALRGINVEYRKENGSVTMKLRHPYTTASMWSSGKITVTGANSEEQSKVAARRYARFLQKLGFQTRFRNFRIVNVLGTCTLPFGVKIAQFSQKYRDRASYEPELHPGVTFRMKNPKATLKIFSTGSITITAPCVKNVQAAVEHVFGLVEEFKKDKPAVTEKVKLEEKILVDEEDDEDSDTSDESEEDS